MIKVVDKIFTVLLILGILATIVFFYLMSCESVIKAGVDEINSSRSFELMQSQSDVDVVKKIFGCYDDESYNAVKSTINMSDDLMKKYFGSSTYRGNYTEKPKIKVSNIRFNPDTPSNIRSYYFTMSVECGNSFEYYNVVLEFSGNKVIALEILP